MDPAQSRCACITALARRCAWTRARPASPEAALIVNGGFFDEADRALGLVISDGQASGQSFSGFGGMLQVDGAGTRVRSLVGEPYAGEPLFQAVQAFPMLIEAGGVPAPQGDGFREVSRRTVVAQDRAGRILFIAVPGSFVSFADLQAWLLASDLDLWAAFALDGGRSTGLYIGGAADEMYPALDQLPHRDRGLRAVGPHGSWYNGAGTFRMRGRQRAWRSRWA